MADTVEIAKGARQEILLFSLDMPAEQVRFLRDEEGALAQVLGLEHIDMGQVELFAAADLEGIGLIGYLHDGMGVPLAELDPHRDMLAAQTGQMLLIRARAFQESGATLTPAAPIDLLLRLGEEAPNWRANPGGGAAPERLSPRAARNRARRIGATLFAIVMALIFLLIYVLAT